MLPFESHIRLFYGPPMRTSLGSPKGIYKSFIRPISDHPQSRLIGHPSDFPLGYYTSWVKPVPGRILSITTKGSLSDFPKVPIVLNKTYYRLSSVKTNRISIGCPTGKLYVLG